MPTWRERVATMLACGWATRQDERDAKNWLTCAIGEQHAARPHVVLYRSVCVVLSCSCGGKNLMPADYMLYELGTRFYSAIANSSFWEADSLLDQIDDRVLQLKRRA